MDMGICCFSNIINDVKPKPFDHRNIYQQFKIHRHHPHRRHSFFASSLATDGLPPRFLRKKGWELATASKLFRINQLSEAPGLDNSLRTALPSFEDFPITNKRSRPTVVGKWYCPFVFVKEEARLRRHQMKKCILYKMTLEQRWEEIGSWENVNDGEDIGAFNVDVNVRRELNLVYGVEGVKAGRVSHDGFVWFRVCDQRSNRRAAAGRSVGLSVALMEKMKWLEEEGGWVGGREKEVRVHRVVEIGSRWRKFGCYVLVESFVLRRLDGSLVLKCDFRHTHRVQCKWE